MTIEELKKEYAEQDNRCTAWPIYVVVQRQVCVGVMADGYGVSCPYGDGETKTKFYHHVFEDTDYDTLEEAQEHIKEYYGDNATPELDNIRELNMGYIWIDEECFLTIKGAREYIELNRHNLGKCRTYVKHFCRRNHEMRDLLSELGFKSKG